MDSSKRLQCLAQLEKDFSQHLEELKELVRIPSVSFEGYDPLNVKNSALAVKKLLISSGLENVQLLEIPGAHPYVYGEKLGVPDAPTLLLYAHHDVQPPGRSEVWKTDPFTPVEKDGPGGKRLFGRGAADDKAGIIVHTAAVSSVLRALNGRLPLNVKVIIEGEEEIGSHHLAQFVRQYRALLKADVLVLTDSTNFDVGVPALTTALRGMVGLEIELRSLEKSVHSGMWGGPLPDPAMALTKILATLVDAHGNIAIASILEQVKPLSLAEEDEAKRIPYDEKIFREQSGLLPQTQIHDLAGWTKKGISPLLQTWRYPSLTINAIQASSKQNKGNIINDSAWAKVTIRLVSDMDPEHVVLALESHLKKQVPWGLKLELKREGLAPAWNANPDNIQVKWAFNAGIQALQKGYGVRPLLLGCGGTIPFVEPLCREMGGAPALLIGVEDPYTNAHGENESLLISDFQKACLSEIHLFFEILEAWKNRK